MADSPPGSAADPGWAAPAGADAVYARIASVRERIGAAGGDPAAIRLIAVAKGFGPEAVRFALAAGVDDIGENYASELRAKAAGLDAAEPGAGAIRAPGRLVRWHYLGAVQRRSVRTIAPLVAMWHGVCRVEEGVAIAAATPGAPVLVELELTGLPGRRGVEPGALASLVAGLRDAGVVPVGVMAIGAPGDPVLTRRAFERAAAMAGETGLAEVSIGMSDDLEIAVRAGATMVRVGRAIFGERPRRRPPEGSRAK